MRRLIAFDWDDTLVDYNGGLVLYHNQEYGTELTYEGFFSHDLPKVFGCDLETITARVKEFNRSPDYKKLRPVFGSYQALHFLGQDYDLEVVTNRAEEYRSETIADAQRHFQNPFRNVHFGNGFGTTPGVPVRPKSEICKTIEAAVLIEDGPGHAKGVADCGIPVLMPHRPWNRDDTPSGVVRVDSWEQACQWIDKNVRAKARV